MNIDWSKAPEGATHYHPMTGHVGGGVSDHWFKPGFFCVVGFESKGWVPDINPLADRSGYIAKLEDWNGEGLPPAGTVCELRAHKLTEWSAAIIEFAYRNVIVWDWVGEPAMNGLCTAYSHDVEFRPIRTPEQIEAEAYQRNLGELADHIGGYFGFDDPRPSDVGVAEYLLDHGYRKFEIVEGE